MDSLRIGKYFLQVVPIGTEASEVFPTYYIASKLHSNSDTLYIKSDLTFNMELLPKNQANNDNHRITGQVLSDDSSVANTGGRLMSSRALADFPVYLLDEKGEVAKEITVTDKEGYFKFNEKSDGTYRLALDIVGSTQSSTSSLITLDNKVELLDITARVTQNNTISVAYSVNIITGIQERINEILIYPNPVNDKFILNINSADAGDVRFLNIYSGNGKLMKQFNKIQATDQRELDVSELPQGLYLLQVTLKTRSHLVKFIKLE